MSQTKEVIDAFDIKGTHIDEFPYGNGHINDTFCVVYELNGKRFRFIRQRINKNIFKNVPALMNNISLVINHQYEKLSQAGIPDIDKRVLTLVPTKNGENYFVDSAGNFWRTYIFLENLISLETVEKTAHAFETAKAFGEFQRRLADLDANKLTETIPNFHHTRSRFNTLISAVENDKFNRAKDVRAEIDFVLNRESIVDILLNLQKSGVLPTRITHNDTKLNNVMLNAETGEGMCVIDLDTVMPGLSLYDFGDMVRTATSTVEEDERDLSKANMDINMFSALVKGFLTSAGDVLVEKEIELLPFSGKLITFEIGVRFLTDYLQGDSYFKIHRKKQNVDRCRKQFKMVESMEEQEIEMIKIVEKA